MQDNIQDWFELDEGDPGFQLLTEEDIAAVKKGKAIPVTGHGDP
jgi:hypothetical protein